MMQAHATQVAALALCAHNKNAHVLSWLRLMRMPTRADALFLQHDEIPAEPLGVLARWVTSHLNAVINCAGMSECMQPCQAACTSSMKQACCGAQRMGMHWLGERA